MSVPHTHPLALPKTQTVLTPADRPLPGLRLRLKPKAPPTGHVDGAWWPHSRDLSAELPALVRVLGVRLGRVTRVTFSLDAWDVPPRLITVDGDAVRLEGFHSQDQYVLNLSGPDRRRVSLLVIPPDAAPSAAHDALMTASHRGNTERPVEILATGHILPDSTVPRLRLVTDDSQSRWTTDGGRG